MAQVAREKAGILRADARRPSGQQPVEAAVLLRQASRWTTVAREGLEFGVARAPSLSAGSCSRAGARRGVRRLFLPLHGAHQAHNAACALAAVEAFFGAGHGGRLDIDAVRAGFAAAESPGRLETVRSSPTIVLDGAHNEAGAKALAESLIEEFAFDRLVGVVGILSDKNVDAILSALEPVLSAVVITQNSSPRAMPADELAPRPSRSSAAIGSTSNPGWTTRSTPPSASPRRRQPRRERGHRHRVVVTVGEARRLLRR